MDRSLAHELPKNQVILLKKPNLILLENRYALNRLSLGVIFFSLSQIFIYICKQEKLYSYTSNYQV
jgi:hypothetical protein